MSHKCHKLSHTGFKLCLQYSAVVILIWLLLYFMCNSLTGVCYHSTSMSSISSVNIKMAASWPKVFLFGDSITQLSFGEGGWGAFIADKLQRKCDVLNRGLSGYNSTLAKLALPRLLPKSQIPQVAHLTLFLGANDAALQGTFPQQYVSVTNYVANLKDMVQYLQDGGLQASQILLITPPPLYNEGWKKHCDGAPNRNNSNTGLYAKACCMVAKDHGINVLDLWTTMQEEHKWERFLDDGLHLSVDGNKYVGEQLWKVLEPKTRDIPMQLPDWKDVEPNKPEEAFLNFSSTL